MLFVMVDHEEGWKTKLQSDKLTFMTLSETNLNNDREKIGEESASAGR